MLSLLNVCLMTAQLVLSSCLISVLLLLSIAYFDAMFHERTIYSEMSFRLPVGADLQGWHSVHG